MQRLSANTTEDVLAQYYYTGLLMNIIIVFEPQTDAGDLDLDLDDEDFFQLGKTLIRKKLA